MLSGVQTRSRIPHDEYNVCGIAHVCIQKDDIFMQRRLAQSIKYIIKWGQGSKSPEFSAKGATI